MSTSGTVVDEFFSIGRRIRGLRESKAETQNDLARVLDVSPSSIRAYEKGRAKITIPDLRKIASHYGVAISYFLGEESDDDRLAARIPSLLREIEKLYREVQRLSQASVRGNGGLVLREETPGPYRHSLEELELGAGDELVLEEGAEARDGDLVLVRLEDGILVKSWAIRTSSVKPIGVVRHIVRKQSGVE